MTTEYGKTATSTQELRDFYDQAFKQTIIKDEERAYRWMAQKLFRPYLAGKMVLDVGCGGGFFLSELRPLVKFASGIDLSGEALRIASRSNKSGVLVQSSAEELPYISHSFDIVICLGSLEHFLNVQKALGEMRRVVRHDGWIFVMVPNLFWYKDVISVLRTGNIGHRNQRYEFFATPSEWKETVSKAGLKIEKCWKYNGIAKSAFKQWWKDRLIPMNLSYHIILGCRP